MTASVKEPPRRKTCHWHENEDGQYETECENMWEFTDGGPPENDCNFCPFCGGALTWTPQ